ncbi:hypothetical protein HPB52_010479 [Rhipicephalus sanguineus]|uniref:CCHC-type domain-containing protein n=1 Tax=Rhipicephalus sanguineus TaxID=34632 RepID=A0A9D4PMD3_RHISA|nr:hypothetical protein HPB52_010479 [Rhipicephalus sanguineus]
MIRCTLYRRQTDVCYACGPPGHRADVCPTPENAICRGCGTSSPGDQHVCSPKCAFCGGPQPTADRSCRQRFERRKERRDFEKNFPPKGGPSEPADKSRSRSTSRGTNGEACCHGDRVGRPRQGILEKGNRGTPPEQNNDRIIQLERENAALKAAIEQLRAEMADLRKANNNKSEVPQPPQVTSVETPVEVPMEAPRLFEPHHPSSTACVIGQGPDDTGSDTSMVAVSGETLNQVFGKGNWGSLAGECEALCATRAQLSRQTQRRRRDREVKACQLLMPSAELGRLADATKPRLQEPPPLRTDALVVPAPSPRAHERTEERWGVCPAGAFR